MLDIRDVSRAFDGEAVLRDIDLTVNDGEIMCLLGASGSGKTTLLRIIAGLETTDSGTLTLDNERIADLPVHQRDFGLVFQDFALFPHMTVAENIAFGMKMRGLDAATKRERTQQMLALVGLDDFGGRDVGQLSGGERQRVALARSLAPRPRLLMLDEPLGSLDAALRERLVVELRDIIKQLGLTAVYVTHDQQEAFAVADRIAIMDGGQIAQVAAPRALYLSPRTAYVARFLGLNNIARPAVFGLDMDADCVLLHPDGITLAQDGRLAGTITERVFRGAAYRLTVQNDDAGWQVTFGVPSHGDRPPQVDDEITLSVAEWAVQPLEVS